MGKRGIDTKAISANRKCNKDVESLKETSCDITNHKS